MNRLIRIFSICSLLLFATAGSTGVSSVKSGFDVGETTQSFTVMDVTGKYAGKRICYVCEFQDEPNVIGFFNETSDSTADFIAKMDGLVKSNAGLNAVAVIVGGEEAAPWLADLSKERGLEIPLVYLRKGKKDLAVRLYRLSEEVDNTFLVSVNRKVMANITDIAVNDFTQVADATAAMLAAK